MSHPPPHTSTTHAAGQHLMAPTPCTQHMARDAPAYKSAADTTAAASRTTRANKLAPRAMLHGFQVAQHWEEHEQQGFTGPQHVLQQTTARSRRTEWWGRRPLFFGDVLAHMHGWRDSDDRWKLLCNEPMCRHIYHCIELRIPVMLGRIVLSAAQQPEQHTAQHRTRGGSARISQWHVSQLVT